VQGFFHGAGDVFASAFVGALANEKPLQDAVAISADFTTACIERSKIEVPDTRYGLNFEKEIPSLLTKLFGTF
jgi:pyridoxine kinase